MLETKPGAIEPPLREEPKGKEGEEKSKIKTTPDSEKETIATKAAEPKPEAKSEGAEATKETPSAEKATETLPKPVDTTMTPEAKSLFASLAEKGKNFLRGLYDKIKSSDIVQNLIGHYNVWNNKDRAQGAREKIDQLGEEMAAEKTKQEKAKKAAEGAKEEIKKVNENILATGIELSDADKKLQEDEIKKYEAEADEAQSNATKKETEIGEVGEKLKGYETKLKEARIRLDSRLEAKMESNNKLRSGYETSIETVNGSIKEFDDKIKTQNENIEKLRSAFDSIKKGSAAKKTLENHIALCEKKKQGLEKAKKTFEKSKNELEAKVNKLKNANIVLQNKRDAIMGVEKIQLEKPSTKPIDSKISDTGVIRLEYGGGMTIQFSDEKFVTTDSAGKTEEITLDKASKDLIRQCTVQLSIDDLRAKKISENLIKKIEALEKTSKKPETKLETSFLAKDVLSKWNKFQENSFKLKFEIKTGEDPNQNLKDKDGAKKFIEDKIRKAAPKSTRDGIATLIMRDIEKFLKTLK